MDAPHVTVLLSVYNGEKFLAEAVDSILSQSYKNFEFIIIDDASTDATPKILNSYEQKDSRIRVVTNAVNLRLAASLNKGIALASGELIARMDADDVSLPDRLEKQVAFMQANPNVSVCGTALSLYEPSGVTWTPPLNNHSIRAMLFFESCLYHPTVVMRKKLFDNFSYSSNMLPAEDYDLWSRYAKREEIIFANIPTPLLRYRTNDGENRSEYKLRQREAADKVRLNVLQDIGLKPNNRELAAHRALALHEQGLTTVRLWQAFSWAKKLYCAQAVNSLCSKQSLKKELLHRMLHVSRANKKNPFAFLCFLVLKLCVMSINIIKNCSGARREHHK